MGCTQSGKKTPVEARAGEPAPQTATTSKVPPPSKEETEERALTQLKLIFDSMDKDEDHTVCKIELTNALGKDTSLVGLLRDAGLNPNYKVLEQLDTDNDGRVTWDEFLSKVRKAAVTEVSHTGNIVAASKPAEAKAIKQLKAVFHTVDTNGDNRVSRDELSVALEQDENLRHLMEQAGFHQDYHVIEELDSDKDGRLTWEEFVVNLKRVAAEEVRRSGDVRAAKDAVVIEDSSSSKNVCCCSS